MRSSVMALKRRVVSFVIFFVRFIWMLNKGQVWNGQDSTEAHAGTRQPTADPALAYHRLSTFLR